MFTFAGLTLLFVLLLVGVTLAAVWFAYRLTWRGPQRWMEAVRHQHRLALIVGRWIWFKWAHIDCHYWIVHLDFSAGAVELRGQPPAGCYWSFTYNTWSEVNPSINSETVLFEEDGSYRITFARDETPRNWIPVGENDRLGVVYFRIYEAPGSFPMNLPQVWQNGTCVTREALS